MADPDRSGMDAVGALLGEFIAEFERSGYADPRAYLERAEGVERRELSALIDAYLMRAPRRAFDAETFAGSPAERIAERLELSLAGAAGAWPTVLPELRHRARIERRALAARLAEALGVPDREEKVAAYYHRMEHGLLPASGVSERVLEALGSIVGASAAWLRRCGEALAEGRPPAAEDAVFARRAIAPDELPEQQRASPTEPTGETPPEREWDEVDRLFLGG